MVLELISGDCRHSGNQGTTGRPAKAQDTLQKISLRTRLSKPGEPRRGFSLGEARQAWGASPGLESPALSEIFRKMLWALAGRPVVPWFPLCRQ